ncbi:MAG: hypothetical protein AABW80_02515 [Nanoarchaeota archaeon]
MIEQDDNTSYRIEGHKVGGMLGERFKEVAFTAINGLPGVLVPTDRGVYYSELYHIGFKKAIPRDELDETTNGLVVFVTREMVAKGKSKFNVRRSPEYYRKRQGF